MGQSRGSLPSPSATKQPGQHQGDHHTDDDSEADQNLDDGPNAVSHMAGYMPVRDLAGSMQEVMNEIHEVMSNRGVLSVST